MARYSGTLEEWQHGYNGMKQRDIEALKAIGWSLGVSTTLGVFLHAIGLPIDDITAIAVSACFLCGALVGRIVGDALHQYDKAKGPWDK